MSAPVFACARCGENPRDGDTFLCADCRRSRRRMKEVRVAQRVSSEAKGQRKVLIEAYGWAGWNRRLKGAPRA